MPLYEYECRKCGQRTEKIENFSGPYLKKCPKCGGKIDRLLGAPAIQFKGSCWYVTDYAGKGSGGDSSKCVEPALEASIFPAVQNLLLAASALNLGSALTTLTTAFAAELAELLALPDHVRPMAVIPLGWPAKPLARPRRAPVAEKAHRDRYGQGW